MLKNRAYLYEELPFFDPTLGESLTMVTPTSHRGINCRFGMKGVIAESHFDSHNNFVAILGGQRRYILAHPDQCEGMELYPVEHPSGRHSRIDWSKAYYLWRDSERPFRHAQVNEVVLQAGDLMYLPTFWFHFIVTLNINYQCNSRSGESYKYASLIDKCGFGMNQRGA
jgi:ribosomal protein L16 Arg81 hydroxylase